LSHTHFAGVSGVSMRPGGPDQNTGRPPSKKRARHKRTRLPALFLPGNGRAEPLPPGCRQSRPDVSLASPTDLPFRLLAEFGATNPATFRRIQALGAV